jgi:hypothetical protein
MLEIYESHAQRMVSLKAEQIQIIALGLTGWAIPMVGLYGLLSLGTRKRKRVKRQS